MNNDQVWNDELRDELRNRLRLHILGEVRLKRRRSADILQYCQEYIQDGCPETERDGFVQFAMDELSRSANQVASEEVTWPDVTDCDRLDRVEEALRERGILLWQASPCCDNCTRSELTDRMDAITLRFPGFRDRCRGYAFFIDQNMPEELVGTYELSVFLGYGWISPDGCNVAPEVYKGNALDIAREVSKCLRNEGFEPDWNGDISQKIRISLQWQRRKMMD